MNAKRKTKLVEFDESLDSLNVRVSVLEERTKAKQKPFLERISKWAALVALFLSISMGVITFYEKVILKSAKEQAQEEANVHEWINQLTKLNAQIASAYAGNDPTKAMAVSNAVIPTKNTLLLKIEPIYRKRRELFSRQNLLLLAMEFQGFRMFEAAFDIADDFMKVSHKGADKAEAYWLYGRFFGLPGPRQNPDNARKNYKKAMAELNNVIDFVAQPQRLRIVLEWLQFEVSGLGNCETAQNVLNIAMEVGKGKGVNPLMVDQFEKSIQLSVLTAPGDCQLDISELKEKNSSTIELEK